MKTNPLVFIFLTVIVLGGLFFIFKSQTIVTNTPTISSPSAQPNSAKTFDLVVKDKKLVSGLGVLKVTQGDSVIIKITSDEDDELHLHGYDKSVDLEKDKPSQLKFTGDLTGRFPYELEKSKVQLGVLEVEPKE